METKDFITYFRRAKQRKHEWEQRMEEKLSALEEEMNKNHIAAANV